MRQPHTILIDSTFSGSLKTLIHTIKGNIPCVLTCLITANMENNTMMSYFTLTNKIC